MTTEVLKQIHEFISQHAIYVSKLERAIKNRDNFVHKTCHECD